MPESSYRECAVLTNLIFAASASLRESPVADRLQGRSTSAKARIDLLVADSSIVELKVGRDTCTQFTASKALTYLKL